MRSDLTDLVIADGMTTCPHGLPWPYDEVKIRSTTRYVRLQQFCMSLHDEAATEL